MNAHKKKNNTTKGRSEHFKFLCCVSRQRFHIFAHILCFPEMRFLVALDGSSNSLRALAECCKLVHPGDEVTLLTVFRPVASSHAELMAEKKAAQELLQTALSKCEASLAEKKVVVGQQLLESDDVRNSLVSFAAKFDYCVVGSMGKSGIGTFLMGTVSQYVLSHCTANVIVVR